MTQAIKRIAIRNKVIAPYWAREGIHVKIDAEGHAQLAIDFAKPGAKLVFFGVE